MSNKDSYDIILAGVGGQGVLSVAAVVSLAALKDGYKIRQSEVHGMSQRGGAVVANMRISPTDIESDLIPRGNADVILSMEPVEALRYLDYLKPDGSLITAAEPYVNIPDYPDLEEIYGKIKALDSSLIIQAKDLAKEAGSLRAVNMVLVGALSSKIPVSYGKIKEAINEIFSRKGQKIVDINLKALELGRQ
ncbi:MAG: indolepyruvate oxidoreductase subunit beta [Spirochaetes bacterium]|nr:MAG: indolepyruvate oxidoreductase subunit beta [Spirochaetota bacterium]